MIKLIVGLGNPGSEYLLTRHNVGFLLADAWASWYRINFTRESRFKAEVATLRTDLPHPTMIRLTKPQTYMNLSGESVAPIMHFYQILVTSLIVIHDDIDLPIGTIRLKKGGGHAGHNGLKSIEQHLNSRDFWRIRIGIGRPVNSRHQVADYVLGRFGKHEESEIIQVINDVREIADTLIQGHMEEARQWLHSSRLQHQK